MSEDEFKEEDADDSLVMIREKGSPDEVRKDGTRKEEKPEESLTEAPSEPAAVLELEEEEDKKRQTEERALKEGTETESSSPPAINEWEHFDVVSIVKTRKILTSMLIIILKGHFTQNINSLYLYLAIHHILLLF